ncbi:flavin monoamine oxidase family protein [Solibacillus daqui]|uniref:flavin monoamine oxidase family protein n=1 Tax=Solibacillus daqui TaxID=2912187 RepID=UPI0023673E4E|nr:FAD-dependent oxidoreductase [Solibacillus daqui]
MLKQVIIIGAGLAGLSAAKKLKEQNIPFVLLEAAERVGGKIDSITYDNGIYFELGPQFFNNDMHAFNQLLSVANIPVVETALDSNSIEVDDYRRLDVTPIIQKLHTIEKTSLSEDIPLQTLYEKVITNEQDRRIIESYFCEILNIHPSQASAIASLESSNRYLSEQNDLLLQGAKPFKELTQYLASLFQEELFTNHLVNAIHKVNDYYEVHTTKQVFYAQAVIIAVPPTIACQIQFSESLKTHFMPALQSYVDGAIIKITWLYPQKFWQDKQPLNGVIYTSVPGVSVVDSSKKQEDARLTMFIGAEAAHEFATLNTQTRLQQATALLKQYFGEIAHSYTNVQESIWVNHPYCGGGYSAKVKFDGLIDAPKILRTPHENIVFASSEVALKFPNFMEGAIQAGYNAVDKLKFKK